MSENLRSKSKRQFDSDSNALEMINAGSLQRIADAVELMAKNHDQLVSQRDFYQGAYNRANARADQADRRIAALKGQITKLRKKLTERTQDASFE